MSKAELIKGSEKPLAKSVLAKLGQIAEPTRSIYSERLRELRPTARKALQLLSGWEGKRAELAITQPLSDQERANPKILEAKAATLSRRAMDESAEGSAPEARRRTRSTDWKSSIALNNNSLLIEVEESYRRNFDRGPGFRDDTIGQLQILEACGAIQVRMLSFEFTLASGIRLIDGLARPGFRSQPVARTPRTIRSSPSKIQQNGIGGGGIFFEGGTVRRIRVFAWLFCGRNSIQKPDSWTFLTPTGCRPPWSSPDESAGARLSERDW
jgi:hypothetical protein